jgi:hypothetical protein
MIYDISLWQAIQTDILWNIPVVGWWWGVPPALPNLKACYNTFAKEPIVLPPPESLIKLLTVYQDNTDKFRKVEGYLKHHGIDLSNSYWFQVYRYAIPKPPVPLLFRYRWLGEVAGQRVPAGNAKEWLKWRGIHDDYWNPFWRAMAFPYTPIQVMQFYNHNLITPFMLAEALRDLAMPTHGPWFEPFRWFYAAVPGISDLIRFMVREAFDEDIAKKYGYDAEYPQVIENWLRVQGMNYLINEHPAGAGLPDHHWGKIYWRAHWILPSPNMAYRMLHRLRPGAAQRWAAQMGIPGADIQTTIQELRDLLKIADYPPFWRDRLIAISYLPISRTDLRLMVAEGADDPVPLEERLQDLGYTVDDARVVAAYFRRRSILQLANRGYLVSPREIIRWYQEGTITDAELQAGLQMFDMTPARINMIANTARIKRQWRLREFTIRQSVRAYVRNIIKEPELREILGQQGLTPAEINFHVAKANIQRLASRRRIARTDILWDYQHGLAFPFQAVQDLEDIGYTRMDAMRMIRRAFITRMEEINKELMRYYRALNAQIQRELRLQMQRDREIRRIMREMRIDRQAAERELERRRREAERQIKEFEKRVREEAKAQGPQAIENQAGGQQGGR